MTTKRQAKATTPAAKFPDWQGGVPPPEGFQYWPVLLSSIDTTAEFFSVTPRAVRNWLAADCPAVHREAEKLPPLLSISSVAMWLAMKRRNSPDFGRHGGYR